MRSILRQRERSSSEIRERTYQYLLNKYFNLFMNRYKFNNVSEEQNNYLLRKFWCDGKIWAFIVDGTKDDNSEVLLKNKYENGMIAFCPFAPFEFNIYDYPISVQCINTRGVSFIPSERQIVNVDGVIGYAQRNKKPVLDIVEWYLRKITDIEMVLKNQLNAHKVPLLIKCTPENEAKMKNFTDRVMNDETSIYIGVEDDGTTETMNVNNNYIIDKLYTYKQQVENELLTFLGIDNVGGVEKKEHLVVDEVNSNNDIIEYSGDCIFDCLKEFCEKVKEVLGYELSVEVKEPQCIDYQPKEDDYTSEDEKEI